MSTSTSSKATEARPVGNRRGGMGRARLVAVIGGILLAVVILAAYLLTGGFGLHSGAGPDVLVQKGTYFSLPADQFNAVAFIASGNSVIHGLIWDTWGVNLYLMTPGEVVYLSEKGAVEGYTWSSGHIANLTETNLSISLGPGQWNLVFLNPDQPSLNTIHNNQTIIGFYTDVTLNPA